MPFTITMPKLSPTMESGVIATWHKKEGDFVNAGDVLLEVSTDKATVEHTALDEGWLRKILIIEGAEANVNQPIAILTESENESIEGFSVEEVKQEELKEEKQIPEVKAKESKPAESGRIFASPLAKKMANEKGIDLSQIQGSGPRNRIVLRDLETAAVPVKKEAVAYSSGSYEEISLSPVRKIIAERLQEAKSTIPHFYIEKSVDATSLVHFREQLSKHDVKVSINDLIIKAVALALKKHPEVNSGFEPKRKVILQYKTIDISVAVSVAGGLITPIVFNADRKSLPEISTTVRSLVAKAKEGKLQPQEFQGGSFTISNLGMFGVKNFQAIINPPQSAILAVSSIFEVPVVKEGLIVPGKVMNITLSCDHRVVDGVAGAEFLRTIQEIIENPLALLL